MNVKLLLSFEIIRCTDCSLVSQYGCHASTRSHWWWSSVRLPFTVKHFGCLENGFILHSSLVRKCRQENPNSCNDLKMAKQMVFAIQYYLLYFECLIGMQTTLTSSPHVLYSNSTFQDLSHKTVNCRANGPVSFKEGMLDWNQCDRYLCRPP